MVVAVVRRAGDDRAGALAGLIAYYAFFSLFPLLLVLVTVVGWALAGDPALRDRVVDSAVSQFPAVGSDLRDNIGQLEGNGVALAIGLVTALWAGLGVGRGLQVASDTVWSVPIDERPLALAARLRALAVLIVLGTALLVGVVASGFAAGVGGAAPVGRSLGAIAALAAVGAALWATLRILAPRRSWADHLPGAVLAAVGWAVLQLVGTWFVDRVVRRAGGTYGVFAVVIGLLVWLSLLARLLVTAMELNVVRARRLWPRALLAPPRGTLPTPADHRASALDAAAARHVATSPADDTST